MKAIELTPEELIGPLNEVEAKYAPPKLYAAGDATMLLYSARVSIVGSRDASESGVMRARKLARRLAKEGVVVVSGLAKGIDTAAHRATLEEGGHTVGVIGTPIDKSYPKENSELQARLMSEQLVLSQFPVGKPVHPSNFPIRNRVMALISDATVIIEAGETSGSLSQGWEALRLGRPLFITQSIVSDKSLTWPLEMLNYGAYILSEDTIDDLFAILPNRAQEALSDALPI